MGKKMYAEGNVAFKLRCEEPPACHDTSDQLEAVVWAVAYILSSNIISELHIWVFLVFCSLGTRSKHLCDTCVVPNPAPLIKFDETHKRIHRCHNCPKRINILQLKPKSGSPCPSQDYLLQKICLNPAMMDIGNEWKGSLGSDHSQDCHGSDFDRGLALTLYHTQYTPTVYHTVPITYHNVPILYQDVP